MPAVSRFGVIGLVAVVACWTGNGERAATPIVNNLEPGPRDITGPYWCSIDQAGYEYPRYACMIKKVEGRLMLAKLAGSQRIRGHIRLDGGDGFVFDGELYCPWGDCTEQMRGYFRATGKGGYKGTLNAPLDDPDSRHSMIVHLVPAPANAFGGSAYGGDGYGDPFGYGGGGYGGAMYGGAGYGGAGYGGYRIDRRGRRRP